MTDASRTLRIAVLPGDGVGPEVVDSALVVLAAAADQQGLRLALTSYPHSQNYREADGSQLSDHTVNEIGGHDALLFGAQGGSPAGTDVLADRPLIALTNKLQLSLGVRSARLYHPRLSPLRSPGNTADILLVRDVSEDCYVGPGGAAHLDTDNEVSAGLMLYTRACVDQVLAYALAAARRRRSRLTLVTQVEGVPAHRIWHHRLDVLAADYPDVEVRTMLPDTAASQLVDDPSAFDVIATTYWIGGILSNLMASVVGGVGLLPSARLNLAQPFGLFEPAHGTAPRHVGRHTVSPVATIRAVSMLLDFVGEPVAADRIEQAVAAALRSGRVPDVSSRSGLSTDEVAKVVVSELENGS